MPLPTLICATDSSTRSRRLALVVEDNVVSRKLNEYMLKHEGFDVIVATDGQEAVEKFKQYSFDLVLMDVEMPVMDGLEATSLMRRYESESGRHTPIVAVTSQMDRGTCMAAGMDAYLEKPIQVPDFHEMLAQVCPNVS